MWGLNYYYLAFLLICLAELATGMLKKNFISQYPWKESAVSLLFALITFHVWNLKGHSPPYWLSLRNYYQWFWRHTPHLIFSTGWGYWISLYFIFEFLFYWNHRLNHKFQWLWLTHGVHHTTTKLNIPAGMRSVKLGIFSFTWLFYFPLAMAGFYPGHLISMFAVIMQWQTLMHTELVPSLGFLEWIFMTPSNHRLHHSCDDHLIDRNFGGTLVIFDLIFDTYMPEPRDIRMNYGVKGLNLNPINPLAPILGIWVPIFKHYTAKANNIRLALPTWGASLRKMGGRIETGPREL